MFRCHGTCIGRNLYFIETRPGRDCPLQHQLSKFHDGTASDGL